MHFNARIFVARTLVTEALESGRLRFLCVGDVEVGQHGQSRQPGVECPLKALTYLCSPTSVFLSATLCRENSFYIIQQTLRHCVRCVGKVMLTPRAVRGRFSSSAPSFLGSSSSSNMDIPGALI